MGSCPCGVTGCLSADSTLRSESAHAVDAADGGGGVSITTYDGASRPSKTTSTSHGCLVFCDAAGFLPPSLCGGVGECGGEGVCGGERLLLCARARSDRSASERARSSVDVDASTWSPSSTMDTSGVVGACGVLGVVMGIDMGVVVGVAASPTFVRVRKGGASASEVIDIWPLPTR